MADQKDLENGKPPADDAGKISHDARGNAVWQWAGSASKHALDSTSKMLKRLEVPGLALLDESQADDKPAADQVEALKAKRATGFDPYEGLQKPSAAPQQKPGEAIHLDDFGEDRHVIGNHRMSHGCNNPPYRPG